MFEIFNFFGGILGYLLWALYLLVRNYGVAIIIFTVVLKVILFPTNIKQQKNMGITVKSTAKRYRNYMKKKASVPLGDA